MKLTDEFSDMASEADEFLADEIKIIDDSGQIIAGILANVGEFQFARELTVANNIKVIRAAHVTILRASNPSLAQRLNADSLPAVPNGWQIILDGVSYLVTNASADEVSWEFDVQQGIS